MAKTETISPEHIDSFSSYTESFTRALESNTEDAMSIATGVLANAAQLAGTLIGLSSDPRIEQARSEIQRFFGQAAKIAKAYEPSLVPKIEEVAACFEPIDNDDI
jgi:hypothetical protein